MKLYKVRRKTDGLFYGNVLEFNEEGRFLKFERLGWLFKYLVMTPEEYEVIEFDITEGPKVNPGQLLLEQTVFEKV